jgi:hypothetical protein
MKLTTHLQPVPRVRISGAIPPLPIRLHGVDRKTLLFIFSQQVHTHTYTYIHTHTYIYIMHTYTHTYIYIPAYIYIHAVSKTDVWPISKNKLIRNHYNKFAKFTNEISFDKLNAVLN